MTSTQIAHLQNEESGNSKHPWPVSYLCVQLNVSDAANLLLNNQQSDSLTVKSGVLTLHNENMMMLKAGERKAAIFLQNIGYNEIQWLIKDGGSTDGRRIYLCPVESCAIEFISLHDIKLHSLELHNDRPFQCDHDSCKWSFHTKAKLERHKASHASLKTFSCPMCSKTFKTRFNLLHHKKVIHEKEGKYLCPIKGCGAAFHNQRNLDLHRVVHSELKPSYRCDYEGCCKLFLTRNALCSHSRSHDRKVEDLTCTWEGCNKVFDVPCRLREHMKSHTGVKPFVCDHEGCGWSFPNASKLLRHRNSTHLQIRKHVCSINNCNKSFLRAQHLRDHMHTHSGRSQRIPCPRANCEAWFGARCLVYQHVKKVHRVKTEQAVQTSDLDVAPPATQWSLLSGEDEMYSPEKNSLPSLMSSELLVEMSSIEAQPTGDDFNIRIEETSPPRTSRKSKAAANAAGAARTSFTYSDVMRDKTQRHGRQESIKQSKQTNDLANCKLSIPADVVLGGTTTTSDPHSLIIKDELYTQEDLQVLLLDPNPSRHSEFEPSTINLRDLE